MLSLSVVKWFEFCLFIDTAPLTWGGGGCITAEITFINRPEVTQCGSRDVKIQNVLIYLLLPFRPNKIRSMLIYIYIYIYIYTNTRQRIYIYACIIVTLLLTLTMTVIRMTMITCVQVPATCAATPSLTWTA